MPSHPAGRRLSAPLRLGGGRLVVRWARVSLVFRSSVGPHSAFGDAWDGRVCRSRPVPVAATRNSRLRGLFNPNMLSNGAESAQRANHTIWPDRLSTEMIVRRHRWRFRPAGQGTGRGIADNHSGWSMNGFRLP